MTNDIVIKAENISKKYCKGLKHTMLYGIQDIARNAIGMSSDADSLRNGEFWALEDVSLEMKKGEILGVIGANGSGKSTLLKLLNGIFMPDKGRIEISGKVSALIEVGAGFHPMLTGRENIYVNGSILGMSKREIDKKFDEIVVFADIGDFIDSPVKHYSSGMYVRLGFAVAVHCEPDILLVDEVLAVGDIFFQTKCITKMKELMSSGVTMLFVSHDMSAIKSICQKAMLFSYGSLVACDKASNIIEKYFSGKVASEQAVLKGRIDKHPEKETLNLKLQTEEAKGTVFINNREFLSRASFQRIQNGKASFVNVQLLDENNKIIFSVEYAQVVTLRMAVEVAADIPALVCGYHIRDKNGSDIVYSDNIIEDKILHCPKKGEKYIIDWKFATSLMHGNYTVATVLSVPVDNTISQIEFLDFVPIAVQFEMNVRRGAQLYGSIHWQNSINVTALESVEK